MSLSSAEIRDITSELAPLVEGARVRDAVFSGMEGEDLLFFLEITEKRTERLIVSFREDAVRLHRLTLPAPPGANVKNSALAAHPLLARLRGAEILQLTAVAGERIVNLIFRAQDGREYLLRFELFPRRPNWVLVRDGVVELLRSPVQSRTRELRAGAPDAPPLPRPASSGGPEDSPGPAAAPSRFAPPDAGFATSLDAEKHYHPFVILQILDAARRDARKRVEARMKARRDRIAGVERQIEEARGAPALRRTADLLRAAQHSIPRGASEARVVDYYDPNLAEITIPLDPAIPIAAQAEKLYHRARRMEAGLARAAAELELNKKEAAELSDALEIINSTDDLQQINDAVATLIQKRILRDNAPPKSVSVKLQKAAAEKAAGKEYYKTFTSADGFRILVGEGARENDHLSLRVAHGNDLWLHVDGVAGAHVVVPLRDGQSAPLETLLDAATLAVHFSKQRGRGRAEIAYTLAKHVAKPRGAPPGLVTITGEKRMLIDLDRERLDRLMSAHRPQL